MATDRLDPAGISLGTTGGAVFARAEAGDSWHAIARHLPAIRSLETVVLTGSSAACPAGPDPP